MADPLIIKICGIKSEAILDAAVEAGADMVGLMHFPRSPRHLELDPIAELISLARGRIETCVVLVNPDNTLMKACSIGSAEDVAHVAAYAEIADRILLDAKPPKGADRPGGLGDTFDWGLLKALDPSLGFMLSGGLTPDTVAAAIKAVRPMGVDVSSGVEKAPGVKDAGLVRAFIEKARAGSA
jgi:phosphoribosylanthranilate isomerase